MRVAVYMACSPSRWIKIAWKREYNSEYKSLKREAEQALREFGLEVEFREEEVWRGGEKMEKDWAGCWTELKKGMKNGYIAKLKNDYKKKAMQSQVFVRQENESPMWLNTNITPQKMAGIMDVLEQMVETRKWKVSRGIGGEDGKCRLCKKYDETVQHLLAGCEILAGAEYLRRHNNALMVLAVRWAVERGLLPDNTVWYTVRWEKGQVLKGNGFKLCWDFEYRMRKTSSARRPDLTLEDEKERKIWIVDMSCPQEQNIEEATRTKLQKYQQLVFEIRERRSGYRVEVVPVIIGCLGGGIEKATTAVKKIIGDEESVIGIISTMQRTVLFEGETIIRKVLGGVVQTE